MSKSVWQVMGIGALVCMAAACTPEVDTGPGTGTDTQCKGGKCDGVTGLPKLETIGDLKTGLCVWTGQADDTMALECAMGTIDQRSLLQHGSSYVAVRGDFLSSKSMNFKSADLDGTFRQVATVTRADYEREPVAVEVLVSLTGANGNSNGISYFVDAPTTAFLEEGERSEFELVAPIELRPISFWPSPELVAEIEDPDTLTLMALSVSSILDLTDAQGIRTIPDFTSTRVSVSVIDGIREPRKVAGKVYYVPVLPGAGSPVTVSVALDAGEQPKHDLTEPGYYVVGLDKSLTLTDPSALPDIGPLPPTTMPDMPADNDLGAPDMGSEDMPADVDEAPDMPPVDPCMAQCTSDQACVAGQCVRRASQQQQYCNEQPSKACDAGEDADCADGNVCVEGLCRKLTCQQQQYCNEQADALCIDNTDCADGNVCADGLCHKLTCQQQQYCSDQPSRPCDGEDVDCAEGNVCVEGLCRKLTCQQQQYCSDQADTPCEGDNTKCADGNVCADGLCHKLTCQQQQYCSDQPSRPCDDDSADCNTGHSCVDGLCVKDTCM